MADCPKCGERRVKSRCAPCHAKYMSEWYRRGTNAEKVKGWVRRYKRTHERTPDKPLTAQQKARIRERRPSRANPQKQCECGATMPEFKKRRCDVCVKAGRDARRAQWAAAHPEKNRASIAAGQHRRRARKAMVGGTHGGADVRRQFVMQDGRCFYCDSELLEGYEVDHIIPISRGGSNGAENICCACPRCNRSKGAKMPLDWALARRRIA